MAAHITQELDVSADLLERSDKRWEERTYKSGKYPYHDGYQQCLAPSDIIDAFQRDKPCKAADNSCHQASAQEVIRHCIDDRTDKSRNECCSNPFLLVKQLHHNVDNEGGYYQADDKLQKRGRKRNGHADR